MSKRKFIFRGGATELTLPVTPESYRVETGVNIETVNIHTLGDVILTGYGTLAAIKIACMLPENDYPFSRSSSPDRYIKQLEAWVKKKTRLRFVIGGTGVNLPVVIESISYGEQDGTNDVYADVMLREYRALKAVKLSPPTANKPRETTTPEAASISSYTAKAGDTLCSICRKYYGDDSADTYNKLARYNGRPNPNILYVGETLEIPRPLT